MKNILKTSSVTGFIVSVIFVMTNAYKLIYNYENLETWKIYALIISVAIFLILTLVSIVAVVINFKKVNSSKSN